MDFFLKILDEYKKFVRVRTKSWKWRKFICLWMANFSHLRLSTALQLFIYLCTPKVVCKRNWFCIAIHRIRWMEHFHVPNQFYRGIWSMIVACTSAHINSYIYPYLHRYNYIFWIHFQGYDINVIIFPIYINQTFTFW